MYFVVPKSEKCCKSVFRGENNKETSRSNEFNDKKEKKKKGGKMDFFEM